VPAPTSDVEASGVQAKPTLMLLDGNSLAFRAFYALPAENFKTRGGLTTNAVYGFTAMLINLLRDEAPTHIAAAFDVSRQTFRSERYPEYKANRSTTPDEFRGQIDITKEVLGALGITVLAEPGFEADDLIATLATQAENEGYRVLVVTGDRDSLQLVSDDVTVLYPRKGVSELTRFTPDAVVEKYGLTPAQYPDFAALRGDPSDNLPGIPGVGEKTASKWIVEYGSLQGLVDNIESVRGKVGDALRAHLASVVRNRELTDLVKDVPLAQTPDTLRLLPWDRDHIHRLFDDLEFRVLRDRLFDTLAAVEPEVDAGFDVRGGALEAGELALWLAEHSSGKRFGLAVVGTHLAYDADATALAIVSADGEGRYIDTSALDPDDEAALASWLADPGPPKALHEAKLAMHDLAGRGWTLAGVTSDTALAAYLVRPGQRSFSLDDLSLRYLRRELRAENPEQQQLSLLDDPEGTDDQAVQTLILRAVAVLDLADALDEELARINSTSLLGGMELPVQRVLAGKRFRPPDPRRGRSGLRGDRQANQSGLAETIADGAVRRAGDAEDETHQDRLHDRRGRPAVAVRQDRPSVLAASACPPRRHPAQSHRRRVTELGGLRRAHPHHVQPNHRGDGQIVVDRAEFAEHSDPHRGRPEDPRRIRGR
jgi:DNA polymerase-1